MAEYKITRISQDPPREWGEGEKKTFYIKCMVEGHDKAISVGKKTPDALKVGDVIHGTITPTDYETDKFTADKPAFGGGKSFNKSPEDKEDIAKAVALKAAVEWIPTDGSLEDVTTAADYFLAWLTGKPATTAVEAPKRDWSSVGSAAGQSPKQEDPPMPPDFLQQDGF